MGKFLKIYKPKVLLNISSKAVFQIGREASVGGGGSPGLENYFITKTTIKYIINLTSQGFRSMKKFEEH